MRLMAIDPGNIQSAYCVFDAETMKPLRFGKVPNEEMENILRSDVALGTVDEVVIEMIGHYGTGMPAGREVFDTCIEIGKLLEICEGKRTVHTILRPTIKADICGTSKAKDSNVIQALKDRFGDKGTKKNPGFFYGFHADCWQAFACGIAWVDITGENVNGVL